MSSGLNPNAPSEIEIKAMKTGQTIKILNPYAEIEERLAFDPFLSYMKHPTS